jgi:CHAT domain-containing protein/Tfp pilus assembly protein PilF
VVDHPGLEQAETSLPRFGFGSNLSFAFFILLLGVLPLKDTQPGAAQAAYQHAWHLFQSGYLAGSQQEAEAAAKRYQVEDPAWASRFTLLEANSMLHRGMFEDALRILGANRGAGTPDADLTERLAIEAVALTRQGQVQMAGQRLSEAQSLCNTISLETCGDVFAASGILAAKFGRFDQAEGFFLRALSLARGRRDHWLEATTGLNLGFIAMQVDHYDEAVHWCTSALNEAIKWGYGNPAQGAAGNLGWAYYQLGDHERALEQYDEAGRQAARLGNIRNQLKWLSNAGYVYRDEGDWASAGRSYSRALELARQIESREDIVNALEDLAEISVVAGKLDEADSYIRQVTPLEDRASPVLRLTMGELAAARNEFTKAQLLFESVRNEPDSLVTTRLNADYELAKLFERQQDFVQAEHMYQSTLAAYNAARAQLKSEESQLPFGANAAQIYDSYIQLLIQHGRPEAALAAADESRARTLEDGLGVGAGKLSTRAAFDPRAIAAKTAATLLFYWLGEKQSYLWAVTPAKVALFPLPARAEIGAHVERYRQMLMDLRDPMDGRGADGQALYQMLVAPAAAMLQPKKAVIVLDEGVLSKLNFETLLAPGAGPSEKQGENSAALHYLIDDFTFSSAPSLSMLAAAKPESSSRERMLLLGNPVSPNRDFPSLPMFGFEMAKIENRFGSKDVAVFAGAQATPTAYAKSEPGQYAYIHFVSHAVANSTNPLDSAIILSNGSGQEDAYKLYAREIIQHPIDAKLVTISACYGSGTRAYSGEGLVGLSWAFLRAGAHKVIGALWEVSDDSTPRLMDNLYEGLERGQPPAVALHNAKLELLHSNTRVRLPFYWAPFQIYGR